MTTTLHPLADTSNPDGAGGDRGSRRDRPGGPDGSVAAAPPATASAGSASTSAESVSPSAGSAATASGSTASSPPRRRVRRTPSAAARGVMVATTTIALAGLLLLGFAAYLVLLSPIQQSRTQENMYDVLAGDLALAVAPVDGVIPPGAPVAVLEIPDLGLQQVIVEGTTSGALMNGPGHRRDTVLPGQAGVSVLLGRSGLYGAPFGELSRLDAGAEIIVTTGQGRSTYAVSGVRFSTDPIPPPSGVVATLTLSTADPPLAPTKSLLLTADLKSPVLPGRPDTVAVAAAEKSLAGDPSAALPLMLWSQVLLLVVAAATWGYLRWQRWPTYVITTPVLLAVLWNVYENVAQLLPNTM